MMAMRVGVLRYFWCAAALWAAMLGFGQAGCIEVEVTAQMPLALGTLQSQPGDTGFIEVDPREGLSVSSLGASHVGSFGPGRWWVVGPSGSEISLRIEVVEVSAESHPNLKLSELIIQAGGIAQRLPAEGGLVRVDLPHHSDVEGRAGQRVDVGAVMHFRGTSGSEQAHYRIMAECEAVGLRPGGAQ